MAQRARVAHRVSHTVLNTRLHYRTNMACRAAKSRPANPPPEWLRTVSGNELRKHPSDAIQATQCKQANGAEIDACFRHLDQQRRTRLNLVWWLFRTNSLEEVVKIQTEFMSKQLDSFTSRRPIPSVSPISGSAVIRSQKAVILLCPSRLLYSTFLLTP